MIRFLSFIAFVLLCGPALAQAVYKCSADGKLSYSDRPCARGASVRLPPPAAGVAPPGAEAVATQDSRTLLELKKLRIAQQKERKKELDREAAREQREQQKLARAFQTRRKACDKMRLHHKWAKEDLARASNQAREAAQRKVRRQAEALAVECPA
jgi:hypothetical protein